MSSVEEFRDFFCGRVRFSSCSLGVPHIVVLFPSPPMAFFSAVALCLRVGVDCFGVVAGAAVFCRRGCLVFNKVVLVWEVCSGSFVWVCPPGYVCLIQDVCVSCLFPLPPCWLRAWVEAVVSCGRCCVSSLRNAHPRMLESRNSRMNCRLGETADAVQATNRPSSSIDAMYLAVDNRLRFFPLQVSTVAMEVVVVGRPLLPEQWKSSGRYYAATRMRSEMEAVARTGGSVERGQQQEEEGWATGKTCLVLRR